MIWRFLKKLGIEPPYDPPISLLGIYPKEIKIEKDTCVLLFTAALFTIAGTWKQARCPLTDEWIKLWYIYTMQYCSAIKRNTFESVLHIRWRKYWSEWPSPNSLQTINAREGVEKRGPSCLLVGI